MKALSVKQPWANLIDRGIKTIETRVWRTDYRGSLLICSSLVVARDPLATPWLSPADVLPCGVMICIVDVVACRPMIDADAISACVPLYRRAWAWCLANVRPVEPTPVRGQVRFFNVPDELIKPRSRQIYETLRFA